MSQLVAGGLPHKQPDPEGAEQHFGKGPKGKLCCGEAARAQRLEDQTSPDLDYPHADGDAAINRAQHEGAPKAQAFGRWAL